MNINQNKIDDVVLALLHLTAFSDGPQIRAWKGHDWDVLDRLHKKGFIEDPKGKNKSIVFTDEGALKSDFLFQLFFNEEFNPELEPVVTSEQIKGLKLRVSISNTDPEIWREITVPEQCTLGGLHDILQTVFEWEDCHMHQFVHKKQVYGPMGQGSWREDLLDEDGVLLSDLLVRKGSRIQYVYDFGDDWVHDVVHRGTTPIGEQLFCVTGGAMASPPEDSGGVWGYANVLEAFRDQDHPDHLDVVDWLGGDFDPDAFDLDLTNQILQELLFEG